MWQEIEVVPTSTRKVGVMGLGVLGQAVLERLHVFGDQPETAALVLLENLRRHPRGERLRDVIDRHRGY